ncbi:MAG: hypothetical protein KA224_03600 [Steroidobacteraceae bacterium]|jgi:hypothetical protein|nr:hypothetical protein [Steroidobacteraceae bacterium]MCC7200145.1 hypothetical protein [Gammaproteobacteria bacterium]
MATTDIKPEIERDFTAGSFGRRFAASLALVVLTFNPTGWSFVHWIARDFPSIAPLQAVIGIALLIAWAFFGSSTLRSLGPVGLLLGTAFCAALLWLLSSWGWLSLTGGAALQWVLLLMLAAILAVGLSWSHLRRRVAGQADVDEVEPT